MGVFLNKQLGKLQNKNTCIKLLKVNNEHITDTKETADQFSSFFASVGGKTIQ